MLDFNLTLLIWGAVCILLWFLYMALQIRYLKSKTAKEIIKGINLSADKGRGVLLLESCTIKARIVWIIFIAMSVGHTVGFVKYSEFPVRPTIWYYAILFIISFYYLVVFIGYRVDVKNGHRNIPTHKELVGTAEKFYLFLGFLLTSTPVYTLMNFIN